jgi:peptidoglycan/xylan/chitin deacetylase (PgdA/CDA1 family)
METNLWSANTPARFWLCQPPGSEMDWEVAIRQSLPVLGLSPEPVDADELVRIVLGEGQFGPHHWELSPATHLYYRLKPVVPRRLRNLLRQFHKPLAQAGFPLGWPIEERYARFQWEVLRQYLVGTRKPTVTYRGLWPHGRRFAFVITHDIEAAKGQAHARAVADLDERWGFRSSFNFVPELYPLDKGLIEDLRQRGFEIGVHGLRHDARLFSSEAEFRRRAARINQHMRDLGAVGFRSPLTMRNPAWMQALDVEYDSSFFDTDPCEPLPGGTMSIWPFFIGQFVELPYTLLQDSTLVNILGETTPDTWLRKVDFVERYHGMALINTHPDWLSASRTWEVYAEFLRAMSECGSCWHALPQDVARWWRLRAGDGKSGTDPRLVWEKLDLT